jgi:hypothetical protein
MPIRLLYVLNLNFGENIFKISSNFSIPGFRFEKIRTQAEGSYRKINLDLAGNVILDENQQENKKGTLYYSVLD